MSDINQEYAYLFKKYTPAWADAFTKVQGRGWSLLPTHPRNMEERNRVYVDFIKKGYAVYTEDRYGDYYIYTLKLPETGGRVSESRTDNLFREFAQWFGKYGQKWTEDFRKDQGRGWSELPVKPRSAPEYNKVFIDYAQNGYAVYSELRDGFYFIYVKKLPEGERSLVRENQQGMPGAVKPEEWHDLVDSLRIQYAFNFKLVIDDVKRNFPSVPEQDIVDYIIRKYIGAARLRKAVYKPENRLVNVWSISQIPTSFLVEGVGIRNYADLSFDPVKISTLEKTGMHPHEHVFHIDVIKEIIRGYRLGYTDAATVIEDINEVVERM